MKSITLPLAASLLVVILLTLVGHFANTSFAQGNQTNQSGGGGQQNQSGIGTASQIENLTSGDTGNQTGEAAQTIMNQTGEGAQTTMNQTGEAAQTAMNQTGEALTNASKSDVAKNISQGGQEIGQTVANETGDILGSLSEGLEGLIGGGSQSK
jgi:hypothetical protein